MNETGAPARLLAKSSGSPLSPGYHETYAGHLVECAKVARDLAARRGGAFLASMGLDPGRWAKALEPAVTRGAYLHDVGKANHQFQRMVARKSAAPQAFRHEVISLFLALRWAPLSDWIFKGLPDDDDYDDDYDYAAVVTHASLFAVAGHHLKFEGPLDLSPRRGSGDGKLVVYTGHADVRDALEQGRSLFGIEAPISSSFASEDIELDLLDDPMADVRGWVLGDALAWWEKCGAEAHRFVALTKALVVAADLVASAVARQEDDARVWADSVLGRACTPEELQRIVDGKLLGRPPRPFQERVARSPSRVTFVRAGCGTGKTVAAYLWAKERAQGRKVFMCYPTTGTATQGYEDYRPYDLGVDSRLIHSRAEVDIEAIRDAEGDEPDPLIPAARYESLAAWDAPLVLATADVVLGLVQNNRRGLFSFPAIAEGAFVFDEVHTYDRRLFGAFLRFLDAFPGAPVLVMTASLQRERLARLREVLARRGEAPGVVDGPADMEEVERYALSEPVREAPWEEVVRTLRGGGKVLWVANTVEGARAVAREAWSRLDRQVPLDIYHSRYRYGDRVEHHKAVVGRFRSAGPALAIATQVCEVSLDISADMLVTDLCPIGALIQRMGRVNRGTSGPTVSPAPVRVVEVGSANPYSRGELELARRWLEELVSRPGSLASQADLARAFEPFEDEDGAEDAEAASAWLDGGPFSRPASLRETALTVSVVREEDKAACLSRGNVLGKEVTRWTIPMLFAPVAGEVGGWERLNGSFVAPRGRVEYSYETGGGWRK
jgi:CRISPR-associated endonuclease/helicase Cas3